MPAPVRSELPAANQPASGQCAPQATCCLHTAQERLPVAAILSLLSPATLKSLAIRASGWRPDNGGIALAAREQLSAAQLDCLGFFTSLESLAVSGPLEPRPGCLRWLQQLRRLRKLRCSLPFNRASVAALARLSGLTSLSASVAADGCATLPAALAQLSRLEELALVAHGQLLLGPDCLASLPRLRQLHVWGVAGGSTPPALHGLRHLPSLERLVLTSACFEPEARDPQTFGLVALWVELHCVLVACSLTCAACWLAGTRMHVP